MAERLEFDWDEANTSHVARHGVRPEETEQVMANDPLELKGVARGGNSGDFALGERIRAGF